MIKMTYQLTLIVHKTGTRPKSHKLWFYRFTMARTRGPQWSPLSLPWWIDKITAYDFWALYQSSVQWVLRFPSDLLTPTVIADLISKTTLTKFKRTFEHKRSFYAFQLMMYPLNWTWKNKSTCLKILTFCATNSGCKSQENSKHSRSNELSDKRKYFVFHSVKKKITYPNNPKIF